MDEISTLEFALGELRREVQALVAADLEVVTNCDPWTVRRLASHALNNQLFWGGVVTGQAPVSFEETMGAAPYEGDLAAYADDVHDQALEMWRTPGVLTAVHATPLGEVPGSVVINFPTVDAMCHAWDLSASLGRALDVPEEWLPAVTTVVDGTCDDHAREIGLIKGVQQTAPGASATDRLMAQAGRTRPTTSV
jgi:uncharacterized protein (TIGR03086 family)